jgi:hypothetical protein
VVNSEGPSSGEEQEEQEEEEIDPEDMSRNDLLAMIKQGRAFQRPKRQANGSRQQPARFLPNNDRKQKCGNCGAEGHSTRECNKPQLSMGERLCFECNKPGHAARECPDKKPGGGSRPAPGAAGKQQNGRVNVLEKIFAVKDEKGEDVDIDGFKKKKKSGRAPPFHVDQFNRDWTIETRNSFSSLVQPESLSLNSREPEATAASSHQAPTPPNSPYLAPRVASKSAGGGGRSGERKGRSVRTGPLATTGKNLIRPGNIHEQSNIKHSLE